VSKRVKEFWKEGLLQNALFVGTLRVVEVKCLNNGKKITLMTQVRKDLTRPFVKRNCSVTLHISSKCNTLFVHTSMRR
jgi:hypothetical protein